MYIFIVSLQIIPLLMTIGCSDQSGQIKQINEGYQKTEAHLLQEPETTVNANQFYIAPPAYKSQLDKELAQETIERGIDRVVLESFESGGTRITLLLSDGEVYKSFNSQLDTTDILNLHGGYYSQRISLLLSEDSENEDTKNIKRAILGILQNKA